MIDLSTMFALELLQNAHNPRSRDCLFGLLNETQTPMGSRLLRNNILQPVTNSGTLNVRYDALEELTTKEEMFFGVRQGWFGSRSPELPTDLGHSSEGFCGRGQVAYKRQNFRRSPVHPS